MATRANHPVLPDDSQVDSTVDAAALHLGVESTVALGVVQVRSGAKLPAYQTAEAAGMDLAACLGDGEILTLASLERRLVPTGLRVAIPRGFEGQVRPRSGWALKEGVTVLNSPGTIDSDYRGEVAVILVNLSAQPLQIRHGDRIAQLVITPVTRVAPAWVSELDDTLRGAGGFGHTGRS